ncbi:hypothetical protein E4U42_007714, partial [Claviceps africana]
AATSATGAAEGAGAGGAGAAAGTGTGAGAAAGTGAGAAAGAAAGASAGKSTWSKWHKVALYAGAASAVAAAGGAAAWKNREQISEGWSWASSHLEFVGCLARAEELKKRVSCMVKLHEALDVGFANLYTRLGKAAAAKKTTVAGTVLGKDRTFCNLPRTITAGEWMEAVNDAATDETLAHMCILLTTWDVPTTRRPPAMFEPDLNPAYEKMSHDAAGLITQWTRNEWYETSADDEGQDDEKSTQGQDDEKSVQEQDDEKSVQEQDDEKSAQEQDDEKSTQGQDEKAESTQEQDDAESAQEQDEKAESTQD